jgi:hypothetical protein
LLHVAVSCWPFAGMYQVWRGRLTDRSALHCCSIRGCIIGPRSCI